MATIKEAPRNHNFTDLLARHGITLMRPRGMVRCIFHHEKTPSLSIDTEQGVFHCFGCGKQGGVKDFALAVGESWGTTHASHRARVRIAGQARLRNMKTEARVLYQQEVDTEHHRLWARWGEAATTAREAAELLGLFFRRPDLAAAYPSLLNGTEHEYAEALWQMMLIEQQIAGEVCDG